MSAPPDPGRETALRRTAAAYGDTPYHSFPFPETRPAHLAAIAQLFGLVPPDLPKHLRRHDDRRPNAPSADIDQP